LLMGVRRDLSGVAAPTYFADANGDPVEISASAGVILEPTITLDTAAYAAGDVLFDFVAIGGVLSAAGRVSLLQSIVCSDKADNGPTINFLFADASAAAGNANAVVSLSDADSFKLLGHVAIANSDWLDLPNNRVVTVRNIGLLLEAASGTSIYVAAIIPSGGTAGTYAATDFQARFGILQG
jgi:hypothetical protein